MIKRGLVPIVFGIATLGVVPFSWAERINIEVRLPEPRIETLQVNVAGDVTAVTFVGGQTIEDPVVRIKDLANIDLQGFQVSMQHDVISFREADGTVRRCLKKYNTDCVRSDLVDYTTLVLDLEGNITKLLDAQGQELTLEYFNLDDTDIENVSVEDIRSYRVIEYRDLSSGEMVQRILQLSVMP